MSWHLAEPAPALVVHPAAASLDEAHAAIELWEYYSRKVLDGAQRLAVEHMMAENDEGLWAASSTGRAESRQNGKGDEIEVVELWGLTQRGEAILHTAHEAATAASAHARLRDLILGHRDLRKRLGRNSRGQESIQSWNGNYRIEMADKSLIVHRTRTSSIGRGLDDISRLVVDEAQHALEEQLASVTPILAVSPNPQKNYIGSAGLATRSVFWWRLRLLTLRIMAGLTADERFAWLEHSAERVTLDDNGQVISSHGDPYDRAEWARANPAYLSRISEDFLAGQLRDMGPEKFAEEHLCVWAPPPEDDSTRIIPADDWALCQDPDADWSDRLVYAIAVGPDGKAATIAASDGRVVAVLEWHKGSRWLPAKLAEILADKPGDVFLDEKSPAGALLPDLTDAGIEWRPVNGTEMAQACGGLFSAITETHDLCHAGQGTLDIAVANCTRRNYSGAWVWDARKASVDISPLDAVTIARWAALQTADTEPRSSRTDAVEVPAWPTSPPPPLELVGVALVLFALWLVWAPLVPFAAGCALIAVGFLAGDGS